MRERDTNEKSVKHGWKIGWQNKQKTFAQLHTEKKSHKRERELSFFQTQNLSHGLQMSAATTETTLCVAIF